MQALLYLIYFVKRAQRWPEQVQKVTQGGVGQLQAAMKGALGRSPKIPKPKLRNATKVVYFICFRNLIYYVTLLFFSALDASIDKYVLKKMLAGVKNGGVKAAKTSKTNGDQDKGRAAGQACECVLKRWSILFKLNAHLYVLLFLCRVSRRSAESGPCYRRRQYPYFDPPEVRRGKAWACWSQQTLTPLLPRPRIF
jgi:hypothetical protein